MPSPLFFTLPLFLLSVIMLARLAMIVTGIHKGPLLNLFEKYGDAEDNFYITPRALFWSGVLTFSLRGVFSGLIYIPSRWEILGALLAASGYFYTRLSPEVKNIRLSLPALPFWYNELRERTTREERRRLAYMWLRLPLRTRLLYNTHDRAFFVWADLVIMATLRSSE